MTVKLNWNLARPAILAAFVLPLAGCGGINASQSVSPASFFLPGLLKAEPPAPNSPVLFPKTAKEFAFAK